MKFYVTGRSSNFEQIKETFALLKEKGHEITFEWTALPMAKPYMENVQLASEFSEQGIQGIVDADIYIIFAHKDGNGVFTEFGAALAVNAMKRTLKIYAVGLRTGDSMFNFHPAIQWRDTLDEVFEDIDI